MFILHYFPRKYQCLALGGKCWAEQTIVFYIFSIIFKNIIRLVYIYLRGVTGSSFSPHTSTHSGYDLLAVHRAPPSPWVIIAWHYKNDVYILTCDRILVFSAHIYTFRIWLTGRAPSPGIALPGLKFYHVPGGQVLMYSLSVVALSVFQHSGWFMKPWPYL